MLPRSSDDVGTGRRRAGPVPTLALEAGPHGRRQRADQGAVVWVRGEDRELRRERGESVVGVFAVELL